MTVSSAEPVNGAAAAIESLAYATDRALSAVAVATLDDIKLTTNTNGDIVLTFPTLGTIDGVVVTNVYGTTGTPLQQLQVPVWVRQPGAPAGSVYVRAYTTLGGGLLPGNHPARVNAIAWGALR